MKNNIPIFIIIILCLPLSGCGVLIGAAVGSVVGGATGGLVAAANLPPPEIVNEPYPIEYKEGKEWMRNRLKCPKGKNFPLKEKDRGKEAIICPFHKEEINVEEARKRYYYYYYTNLKNSPLPKQFLTERDKKRFADELRRLEEGAIVTTSPASRAGVFDYVLGAPSRKAKLCEEPYPIEYEKDKEWMKGRLMCPIGRVFGLKKSDKDKEITICPYHKKEINIEEAQKRYYYYYYATGSGSLKNPKPLPRQYLTEYDKERYE